ncbi:MAG: polyprenyl synthetase family protein [Candidatus Methanomethylophilaceae archaeon]
MVDRWADAIDSEFSKVEEVILDALSSDNEELDEMCKYVIQSGGKRVRPAVCILSYLACGGDDVDRAVRVGAGFEILHSASLVHDDIDDDGMLRRGRLTLHKKYTLTKALVAGDFMLVRGYRCLGSLPEEPMNLVIKAAGMMVESEFVQKDFEHDLDVTVDDYMGIITGKTAMLIVASAASGAYIATEDRSKVDPIIEYSNGIGLAFQIVDDILDIIGSEGTGKKVGIDLLEGKPTLPIIYAMQDPVHGGELREIHSRPATEADVARALELIRMTDALDKCYTKAEEVAQNAINALGPIPDSVYKDSLIGLAKYIVRRDR